MITTIQRNTVVVITMDNDYSYCGRVERIFHDINVVTLVPQARIMKAKTSIKASEEFTPDPTDRDIYTDRSVDSCEPAHFVKAEHITTDLESLFL